MRRKDYNEFTERVGNHGQMALLHMVRPDDTRYYVCGNARSASRPALKQFLLEGTCNTRTQEGGCLVIT